MSKKSGLGLLYTNEINSKISTIESILLKFESGEYAACFSAMEEIAENIMDLGMIYGYEGVEAIAERMYTAARFGRRKCQNSDLGKNELYDIREKLQDSINALSSVIELADTSSKDLIHRTRGTMDFKIDEIQVVHESEADDACENEADNDVVPVAKNGPPDGSFNFEIREFSAVSKLESDSTESAARSRENADDAVSKEIESEMFEKVVSWVESPVAPEEDVKGDVDFTKAFVNGQIELPDGSLGKELEESIRKNLAEVALCMDNLQNAPFDEVVWGELYGACESLRALDNEVALKPVAEIIGSMITIAGRWKDAGAGAPALYIEALSGCKDLILRFIDEKKLPTTAFRELKSQIRALDSNRHNFAGLQRGIQPNAQFADFDDEDYDVPIAPKLSLLMRIKKFFGMI